MIPSHENDKNITEIVIDGDFPPSCFKDCNNLKNAVIKQGIKTISDFSFRSSGIKTITLPEGLETIGKYAFERKP